MKNLVKLVPIAAAILLGGCFNSGNNSTSEDTPSTVAKANIKLRVMETTDIHMYLANYDYFSQSDSETIGFANTATLIKEARAEVNNSVRQRRSHSKQSIG